MKIINFLIAVLIGTFIQAQEIQISGTVTDATGLALPGVNVIVKGTNNGAVTDFDGKYAINNVQPGATLIFSYVGFTAQEVPITNRREINVQLEEDFQSLEQVVVIGYGTQTKKEITGAVSVVGADDIAELAPVRVEQALQGQVAGVNVTSQSGSPGSASSIRIRGISTNGNNDPLILVDGNVIVDLSVINPNDIESINILKDATAGIYGVRGANGVILITTKSGLKNQPMKFELNSYAGFQNTTRQIPLLNATEYGLILNEAFASGGEDLPFPDVSSLGEGTDWQNEVFNSAPISDINFNVRGGGERSTYSVGVGYLNQNGIVGGGKSNFDRFTGKLNYSIELGKNFKFTTANIWTQTSRKTLPENALGSVLFNALNMAPTFNVLDENGEFTLADGLGNEVINPVAQIANTFNDTWVDKIAGTFGLEYDFWNSFKIETRYQFNYAEVENKSFSPVVFYGSGKVFNVDRNNVTENNNIFRDYTWDTFLKYENTFGENHNFKALLGMSVREEYEGYESFTGFDIPENSYDNATIDQSTDVRNNLEGLPSYYKARLLSYFTRVQYDYNGKYLISATFRRDGSSRFGPENRFGYFPTVSAGWVLTDENFVGTSDALNFFKLRGSYGVIGSDKILDYQYVSLLDGEAAYVLNGVLIRGEDAAAIGALSNPEIRWEKQKTLDIGFDTRLFNNKFDITFDYYKKETEDLLLIPQVSGILGVGAPGSSAPFVNAGAVENQGFEFLISYREQFSENFSFNASYNITTINNKVTVVNSDNGFLTSGDFGVGQDPIARMEAGKPIGYFYGLQTDGIFQNQSEIDAYLVDDGDPTTDDRVQPNAAPGDFKYVDRNNDGSIDSNDRTDLGNPIPDFTMGLSIGFNYKNFDFTSSAFASLGNDIVRNYERNQNRVNRRIGFLDRWTGPGSTNDFPRVTTAANSNNLFSDFYVEDGSFVRIQSVQLGYSLSDRFTDSIGIDKLRFYFSANNLYTFTKYSGYDPSASSGNAIGGGIDQGFYPVPRTFLAGINLKF